MNTFRFIAEVDGHEDRGRLNSLLHFRFFFSRMPMRIRVRMQTVDCVHMDSGLNTVDKLHLTISLVQQVGTGNATNIKLKGLHRLVINNYLLTISFTRCHKYY